MSRGGGLGSSEEDSVCNIINVRSEEAMSEGSHHDDETDDYGLEDLHSDGGTDDEDRPRKQVPKWAEGENLTTALLKQCSMPPDLDQLFAAVETPDLSTMFGEQRKRFIKRTSSACWEQPPIAKEVDDSENMDRFTGSIEENGAPDQVQRGVDEVQGDDELHTPR